MDGTLYGELFPAYFEYLLFCHRVLDDKDYTGADEEMIEMIKEADTDYDGYLH